MGYTEKQFNNCVNKIMKNSEKTKAEAMSYCKLSLSNVQKPEKKEEPWKTVESKDYKEFIDDNNFVFFTKGKRLNTSKKGTLVKDIEVFKAGTFKHIEFKKSALEKMVANFHYLKAHGIFPNVPVRADHPSMFGLGDVVDKVGGYVEDLRLKGNKIVADARITSDDMMSKIESGQYISRSSEIGAYEDNNGNLYDPIFYGFAWVDIPAVEGLSPTFSFSKDKTKKLINLNDMSEEIKDIDGETTEEDVVVEPEDKIEDDTTEEEIEEEVVEDDNVTEDESEEVEETEEEESDDDIEDDTTEDDDSEEVELQNDEEEFKKNFPEKYAELEKLKDAQLDHLIDSWILAGKVIPAQKEAEFAFIKSLSKDQKDAYEELKKGQAQVIELDEEQVIQKSEEKVVNSKQENSTKKAEEFLERTK